MADRYQISLAHAREDEGQVRTLHRRLTECGFHPWLDKINLVPGQLWREEIPKAIADSVVFLACLSSRSVQKQSCLQREFRTAISPYAERPHDSIYLIPVRHDDWEVPDLRIAGLDIALTEFQWVDLFEEDGFERLVTAIKLALKGKDSDTAFVSTPVELEQLARHDPSPSQITLHSAPLSEHMKTPPQNAVSDGGPRRSPVIVAALIGAAGTVLAGALGSPLWQMMMDDRDEASSTSGTPIEIEPVAGPEVLESYRDCAHCPEMVLLPAGSLQMGSPADEMGRFDRERIKHEVRVEQPFALGKTEVMFEEYDHFAEATVREKPDDRSWGRSKRPVIGVSWHDASAYCAWLGEEMGKAYRLPTQAEWEYAARAGTTTPFSFGETITTGQVNYNGNSPYGDGEKGLYREKTVPAGSLPANVWGMHEMHGNFWERVEGWYHGSYEGAPTDGGARLSSLGTERLMRAVALGSPSRRARAAYRNRHGPGYRSDGLSFRCVGVQS